MGDASQGGAPASPPTTTGAPGPKRRFAWITAASDRVPTKWLATGATVVFLAATAAFGGLATVEAKETPTLELGETFASEQFEITVDRAVLLDEFPEAGVWVDKDKGERVLALLVDVENLWTQPQATSTMAGLRGAVRINGLEPADSTARYDDATGGPILQPGVPASIVLTWVVGPNDFADKDTIDVTLNNLTLFTASFVSVGQGWVDPTPGAIMSVELADLGVGAGAEAGGEE